MDKADMRLKKCSTTTDVEPGEGTNKRKKSTERSQKLKKSRASKKLAAHDVTIEKLTSTIRRARKEIEMLKDSFKDMTKTVKKLEDVILKKENQTPEISNKCCLLSEQLDINNERTIFVKGFDPSHDKDDIKSALIEHFGSCGEITRVYVPYVCTTGASIGYAFIDMDNDNGKALTLDGSYLGDRKLKVVKGTQRPEFNYYVGYPYCPHYLRYLGDMAEKGFRERHRGRLRKLTQHLQAPGRV